jgi:hypothetical protein
LYFIATAPLEEYIWVIGRKSRRKSRRRWVDNIKVNLGEIGLRDVDWIGLAQDKEKRRASVNAIMDFGV